MGFYGNNKPKWKREIVSDHKFENVDLDAFHDPSCTSRFGYMFVFIATITSACVCLADLYTAVSLLAIGQTTVTPAIPTEYSKWIFFGCIMVSYLLIVWDLIKARRILKTHDISCSFTSVIANRYLSMKDYRYHCLFKSINTNSKGIDSYAFFIFFTLKGWKRLLLAEAPRQVINVVTLKVLTPEWLKIHNGSVTFNNDALGHNLMQRILTGTMAFSVLVFAISFLLVCAAAILYIPLFCHIRGNLKEYCCHKVDKRISEILFKQGQRGKDKMVNHEAELLIDESYYKRPLASNHKVPSPNLSTSSELYDKLPFQNFSDSSPTMSPSIPDGRSISSHQHLLADNDQGYFNDRRTPENFMGNQTNNGSQISQHYYPRSIAQQLPYQNRAYQYYAPSNSSPQNTQRNIGSPATPSSTCVNEQRYQYKKYPQGY